MTVTGIYLRLRNLDTPYFPLLAVWTLSMISLPIIGWVWGEAALAWGVSLTVVVQVAVTLLILALRWGARRVLVVAGLVAMLTWGVEFLGSSTGFPFGSYHYTGRLQPQVAGVPVIIPLAWLMMLPSAWALAWSVVGGRRWLFALVSALAFTAWDLFLDPQMVSWRFWQWAEPGGYFGIPWTNFLGWLASAFVVTAIVHPAQPPVRPLLFIYGMTWVFMTMGLALFWGLPGPALTGFLGMGAAAAAAWLNRSRWPRT
ncbi:MAG: carotenoid biosynthesis protein [Chloroflexi bacterium]|nr:carotenoid biosynthesis protein [Chloroflexota bacterium]